MQTLLSASMALILLESITKVPDLQVAQTGKSSIFRLSSLLKMGCYITLLRGTTSAWCSTPFLSVFFLLSFLHHDSTITAEAITMIRTLKGKGHLPWRPPIPIIGRTLHETKRVSSHTCYCEDPKTKRVSSHIHYWEDPEKGSAASRVSSCTSYRRNPDKKRAAVRLTNLKAARAKIKWYRQYYANHRKGICASRKSRYAVYYISCWLLWLQNVVIDIAAAGLSV